MLGKALGRASLIHIQPLLELSLGCHDPNGWEASPETAIQLFPLDLESQRGENLLVVVLRRFYIIQGRQADEVRI